MGGKLSYPAHICEMSVMVCRVEGSRAARRTYAVPTPTEADRLSNDPAYLDEGSGGRRNGEPFGMNAPFEDPKF